MRTVVILNPASGASLMASHQYTSFEESEEAILSSLRAVGLEPEVWHTTPADPGQGLAQKAASEGVELVIAAGGDGTLHAVASGLIGTESTLAILPIGTMNNIAHSLEVPTDIAEACQVIATGGTCLVDVGKINQHIFLEVAGIGLEAAIFPAAEELKNAHFWTSLRAACKGLVTLLTFQPTRFRAVFDGRKSRSFKAIQISVCNTPYYGARLQFAPHARMDDGFLDVLIYKNFSTLEFLRHALSISQGRRALEPKVQRRKVTSLSIYADQPMDIHADGNPLGYTPATVTAVPGALRVRVPQHMASGPNVVSAQTKRTRFYQISRSRELASQAD
ncbi:MAG TPA: diacylglycerol kinase family protein [Ktedonobacteraceae bacterium]|nr:diacylglycerol kinase family protein [Ktedonobacteraceae bacterium]